MFYIDGEPTDKPRRTYILQRDKRYQSKAYVTRTRADCLLIAAAPDMKAALDAVQMAHAGEIEWHPAMLLVQRARAKAEGDLQ